MILESCFLSRSIREFSNIYYQFVQQKNESESIQVINDEISLVFNYRDLNKLYFLPPFPAKLTVSIPEIT